MHTHEYEMKADGVTRQMDRYCGAYVCFDCRDHEGLARCYCGWARDGGNGNAQLQAMGENVEDDFPQGYDDYIYDDYDLPNLAEDDGFFRELDPQDVDYDFTAEDADMNNFEGPQPSDDYDIYSGANWSPFEDADYNPFDNDDGAWDY